MDMWWFRFGFVGVIFFVEISVDVWWFWDLRSGCVVVGYAGLLCIFIGFNVMISFMVTCT